MTRATPFAFGLLAAIWSAPSQAQNVNLNCYIGPTAPQWLPCSDAHPLPTTATISGSVTVDTGANATAAAPSYSEGQVAAPISQNLTGDQRVIAKQSTSPWATLDANSAAILAGVTGPIPSGTNVIGGVTQSGTWTVQPGNTANTTPWLVTATLSGSSNAVNATLGAETTKVIGTVNQGTSPWLVSISPAATGAYSFNNIKTSTTTVVKSGAGTLHTVCVNTDGTVASAVALFDNTAASGTTIANINSLNSTNCYTYDIAFATGLTVVTTGTVASDVTISFK